MGSLNGTVINEVNVRHFPYVVDATALGLAGYVHVMPCGNAAPLDALEVTGPGTIKVMPRWDRVHPNNIWVGHHYGNRRFYDEFMEFVMIPDAVKVPNLVPGACGLRLCAVVLQAIAKSLRKQTHSEVKYNLYTGKESFRGRSWKGCVHAIRHHTTLSYVDSQKFVEDFLATNMLLIDELTTRILCVEIHGNHFA